ncbi:MAG: lipid-A-disaccharide synthase N-terminal domain-containing protein [Verrucomicrobiota bacterium]
MFDLITEFYSRDLGNLNVFGWFTVTFTAGKLIGFTGMAMFTGRWLVQVVASKKSNRPVIPKAFWYMSISGSLLLLSYFIFGKNDSVGILSNLFPLCVASYNLYLEMTHRKSLVPKEENSG